MPLETVKDIGEALHAAGVPKAFGDSLWWRAGEIAKVSQDSQVSDDIRLAKTRHALSSELGQAGMLKLCSDATAMIDHAAKNNPAVWDWIADSGLGDDPFAIKTLANLWRARTQAAR